MGWSEKNTHENCKEAPKTSEKSGYIWATESILQRLRQQGKRSHDQTQARAQPWWEATRGGTKGKVSRTVLPDPSTCIRSFSSVGYSHHNRRWEGDGQNEIKMATMNKRATPVLHDTKFLQKIGGKETGCYHKNDGTFLQQRNCLMLPKYAGSALRMFYRFTPIEPRHATRAYST